MGGALALLTTCMVILFGARPASPWGFVQQMSAGNTRRSLITDLQRQFHPWALGSIPFVDAVVPPRSATEKELLDRQAVRYRTSHNDGTTTILSTGRPRRNNPNNGQSTVHTSEFGIYETVDKASESMVIDDSLERLIQKHVRAEIDHQFGTTQPVQDIHCRLQLMELVFKWYYIDPEVFSKLALAMQGDIDVSFCHTREWVSSSDHNNASPSGTLDMLGGKNPAGGETRKEGLFKSLLNFFNTGVNRAENADQEESAVMQRLTMNDQAPPNIKNNTK
ncbi:hypothetical protein BJV82DRAFT_598427 [Fennellomyces sp. T-0311]|nr:hypothetical protein BJV82DRAFT_598427 [Fennellomyces sp. T-0311]